MHAFLQNNRDDLIDRCTAKVALRPYREATMAQLAGGVPLFLDQLIATLLAEHGGDEALSLQISGAPSGDASCLSEMGISATAHGQRLLELGYTVDQVVHDYGDLCQAITDLAVARDAPFAIDEFRTLNRCLDNVIADAVSSFANQRDTAIALQNSTDENQRLGFLVHELRNHLQTATMAFSALESGSLAIGGSTSALLKRNLTALANLLTEAISEVRTTARAKPRGVYSVATLIQEVRAIAEYHAKIRGCQLVVSEVDTGLALSGDRARLTAALLNLLQNAFKFTHEQTEVTLAARAVGERILVEIQDQCGGLPEDFDKHLFKPFAQVGADKSGLGLGLIIARQIVEAEGGKLTVRDLPGSGCVFTIDLPRYA